METQTLLGLACLEGDALEQFKDECLNPEKHAKKVRVNWLRRVGVPQATLDRHAAEQARARALDSRAERQGADVVSIDLRRRDAGRQPRRQARTAQRGTRARAPDDSEGEPPPGEGDGADLAGRIDYLAAELEDARNEILWLLARAMGDRP